MPSTPLFTNFFGIESTIAALGSIALAVGLLICLIAAGKVPPLIGFAISSAVAALLLGMPLNTVLKSIEKGMGELMGSLLLIICLGAMFGKLIADSGAAQKIAMVLVKKFGKAHLPIALAATGLIVGTPLFYNVGFVLLVPLIFSLVSQSGRSIVSLAIPLLCGLSIAHGFLPPHPSPIALVAQFGADMGLTLLYGFIVAIPTLALAGPLFSRFLTKIQSPSTQLFDAPTRSEVDLPNGLTSFSMALLPIILLTIGTGLKFLHVSSAFLIGVANVFSEPTWVMMICFAVAMVVFGSQKSIGYSSMMKGSEQALQDIAPILLIIAGAGALKAVFVDSGVNKVLGEYLSQIAIPPLVLGWLIATLIRICLGSATVAGLTTAGIVAPLVKTSGVDPNLMVLSIGAGSLMCSHVNDSGFWMFKAYFNLSLKDTFKSWTMMETLVGILGLIFVLLLSLFI